MQNRKKLILALTVVFILNIMIICIFQSAQTAQREKSAARRLPAAAYNFAKRNDFF